MSKPNKVNKSNYDQGGRLTPDQLASEQKKQMEVSHHARSKASDVVQARERATAKAADRGGARGGTRPRSAPEE
jgi:hypothetical protein